MTKGSRSRRIALAAGVAMLVALAVVVVTALSGGTADTPTPAPPTISVEAVPNSSGTPTSEAGNELGPVVWTDLYGLALPVSVRFGPNNTDRGRASGFSHDWYGALHAAVHISARAAALVGPTVYRPTIEEQVLGEDADELFANVDADYEERRSQAGLPDGRPLRPAASALAGYRFDSVSDSTVSLRLVTSALSPSGMRTVYVAFDMEVQWVRGDWRLVSPPDGLWSKRSTVIASATGYTRFPER